MAALVAAKRGARVILIEKERVGGTCLNVGCIPTKVLTSATEFLVRAKRAGDFGISIPQAAADLPALMAFKRNTVDQLVGGVEQVGRQQLIVDDLPAVTAMIVLRRAFQRLLVESWQQPLELEFLCQPGEQCLLDLLIEDRQRPLKQPHGPGVA